MQPRLVIDIAAIERNVRAVVGMCASRGVSVCGVTKGVCGDPAIAAAFVRGGVTSIGDSRLDDLAKLADLAPRPDGAPVPRVLIRTPSPDEADRVVALADISVNTECDTIRALDEACDRAARDAGAPCSHGIMLMCDLGDLREGFVAEDELVSAAHVVRDSRHLHLHGIGANLNCLSFILPDRDKMASLAGLARRLEDELDLAAGTLAVSGGNSSNVRLMLDEGLPPAVSELRLGESLLLGRERAEGGFLPGTRNNAFIFEAGIVELKEKPSLPWGTSGPDSFGRYHHFEDRGMRLRAICAFGHQDTEAEVLAPLDDGIEVVDSSSDHTVLDLTDSVRRWHVGDVVRFRCGYHAIDRAFTSQYVEKILV